MNSPIIYLFQANVAILVFYLFYRSLFCRDTFFLARRFLLAGMILFAFVCPLLSFSSWIMAAEPVKQVVLMYVQPAVGELVVEASPASGQSTDWQAGITWIYRIGVYLLLGRLILRLLSVARIWKKSEKRVFRNRPVVWMKEKVEPFSFFRLVFVNPSLHSPEELDEIMIHENTHVRQWHSVDNILAELLIAVCWFNPFAWFIRKEIKLNLEHLADESVLRKGYKALSYQYHLLHLSYRLPVSLPVNYFNVSDFKRRIIMMNRAKSSRKGLCKYLLVAPFSFLLLVSINGRALAERVKSEFSKSGSKEPTMLVQGKVVDEKQLPLPGVNVVIKNSVAGTLTDADGMFRLEAGGLDTLIFSYIGMTVQEVPLIGCKGTTVNVILYPQAQELDPLLVIGYTGHEEKEPAIRRKETARKKTIADSDSVVFTVVEEMPVFPGGAGALKNYLAQHMRYPAEALQQRTEGKVLVAFVISAEGKVENVEIKRGIDSLLDSEALRVVREMPRWQPGRQRGKAVPVMYVLPVAFRCRTQVAGQVRAAETGRATASLKNRKERVIKKEEADSVGFFVISERSRFKPEKFKNAIYMTDGKVAGRKKCESMNIEEVMSVSIQEKGDTTAGKNEDYTTTRRVVVMTRRKK